METFFSFFKSHLKSLCSSLELHDFIFLVGQKLTGLSKVALMTKECVLNESQKLLFSRYCKELSENRPIQYVLGETDFCELKIKVDERALIPRVETSELVDFVLDSAVKGAKILDIGTGSGCIAIALAKKILNSSVTAYDISEEALLLAAENAHLNNVEVFFRQVDILNGADSNEDFDVIVSNPPYIKLSEREEMCSNVLDYEPHLALFVPNNDPLIFYRAIINFAKKHLLPTGSLFFEINRAFSQEIKEMLNEKGFSKVEIRKDMFGNDRMIRACF